MQNAFKFQKRGKVGKNKRGKRGGAKNVGFLKKSQIRGTRKKDLRTSTSAL